MRRYSRFRGTIVGMTRLADAHVVITGGSSGIGLATARLAVARSGARVSLIARDEARLGGRGVATTSARRAVGVASADVADGPSALGPRSTRLTEGSGRATCSSPPPGSSHPGYFEQLDDAVFRDQMEVDYFGTLHAVRAVVPSMIERRPRSPRARLVDRRRSSACSGTRRTRRRSTRCAASPRRCGRSSRRTASWSRARTRPTPARPGFDRENVLKPPETERISAAIKPREADAVARGDRRAASSRTGS